MKVSDAAPLHIESQGDGPDLALIHGWGIGHSIWQELDAGLAARCRLHRVELPGYGASAASPQSFAATAQQLADALPENCTLCGWSLGGMLALQAALLAPQRIGRLILVGSTPSFTQRADWSCAQAPTLLDTFAAAVATHAGSTLQRFIALLNQGDEQSRACGRTLNRHLLATTLPATDTLLAGLRWLRDVDLRDEIAAVRIPTLLIHGDRDPLMPLEAAQWLCAQLPQARLETFAGAAHAPFLNDPERFAKLIGDHCHAPAND